MTSGRGSGLPAVPLIERLSGALMDLVRENYQGERPGHALPISEWVWLGSEETQRAPCLTSLRGDTSGA